jgi:hypothetical protein
MTLSQEKLARLRAFLGALPAGVAARLAAAVEADSRIEASGLPHAIILEALRPKLAVIDGGCAHNAPAEAELVISELDQLADAAGLRLRDDQANLVEVVGLLLERAPHEIAKAMPARARGSFAAIRLPDLSKPVSPELVEIAMRYARLMAACRTDSRVASLAAELADSSRRVLSGLRSYAADMVREKRASVPSRAELVDAQFSTTMALVMILFGKSEAEALRRRAQTAEAYAS